MEDEQAVIDAIFAEEEAKFLKQQNAKKTLDRYGVTLNKFRKILDPDKKNFGLFMKVFAIALILIIVLMSLRGVSFGSVSRSVVETFEQEEIITSENKSK